MKGLSAEDALERKNYETKLSQYNSFAAEKVVVEQGFCNLIPRLLTQIKADDDDHDTVEKIVQALLPLSEHCQQDFFPVRPIILHLKSRLVNINIVNNFNHGNFHYSNALCSYRTGTGTYQKRKSKWKIRNRNFISLNCTTCVRSCTAHFIEKNCE